MPHSEFNKCIYADVFPSRSRQRTAAPSSVAILEFMPNSERLASERSLFIA
jgi:hypothetical protein